MHLQAVVLTVIYLVVSKIVFVNFVINKNILVAFFGPYIFGVLTSFMFLYLFSHEDFFHFMKEVEKKEKKKENEYLKKYKHLGKIAAVMVIGTIGGTILAALTVRLLLAHLKYRYLVLLIAMFFSTIFTVGIAKGLLNLI